MADIAEGMIEIEILENPKGEEWQKCQLRHFMDGRNGGRRGTVSEILQHPTW